MPDTRVRKVTIFVSSPIDVAPERGRVQAVAAKLNREYEGLVRFETVLWEEHFYTADKSFQPQIPEAIASDIVVSIFWTRIGTELPAGSPCMPNGKPYPSGTAYELLTALEASKAKGVPDVYVFRKIADATVPMADAERRRQAQTQLDALEAFWSDWFRSEKGEFKAAFQNFPSTDAFEQQIELLLRQWLDTHGFLGPRIAWPKEKGSPFRGLAPFEAEHAAVFFGRARVIDEARRRLVGTAERGTPFLLIVGASGSGKSSLARAGLIPRLTTPGVVTSVDLWRVARMKPGEGQAGPLKALATALLAADALPELAQGDYPNAASLADNLRRGGTASVRPIISALRRVAEDSQRARRADQVPKSALMLLVDQFEELFAQRVSDAERAAFAESLRQLIATGRVWVVATLRADLYELLLKQPGLKALKETGASLDLGPPGPAELAEIVRAPAAAAELVFETNAEKGDLGERLLGDAKTADSLPLLQFTLRQLYERREEIAGEIRLTHAAYDQLGGLAGAIAAEAERAVSGLPPDAVATLPRLLRRLAEPARGGKALTLREVLRADVASKPSEVTLVDALLAARILIARTDADGRPTVRLAHDAVLASWPRASEAAQASREFYRVRAEVEDALQRWQEHGRPKDRLIQSGVPLAEAEKLVADFGTELPVELTSYVKASRNRARVQQRLVAAAAVVFLILAVGAAAGGGLAYRSQQKALQAESRAVAERDRATQLQQEAEQKRNDLLVSQSRFLVDRANQENQAGDAGTAMLLALQALPDMRSGVERPFVHAAEAALFAAYQDLKERIVLNGHKGLLWSASFAPDGRRIVTASEDNTARVWSAENGDELTILRGHTEPVRIASFSPDGRQVLTASTDKTARLWDAETGQQSAVLEHDGVVRSAAFSSDGRRIVTASDDKTARVWDVQTGKQIAVLTGHTARVRDAAFSPNGRYVLTASDDKTARLWDSRTGELVRTLEGHTEAVRGAAFSPDGERAVTTSLDHSARVWSVETGKPSAVLEHDDVVSSAAFSPDNRRILTVSGDNTTAGIWDAQTGERIAPLPGQTAAFSPDGHSIVTSDGDAARIWNADRGEFAMVLRGHRSRVTSAVFSPDGRYVLTASDDKTARLWSARTETNTQMAVLAAHMGSVRSAVFSPDGRRALTASDNSVRLWDAEAGRQIAAFTRMGLGSAAFGPDGRLVAVPDGNTVVVRDANTGEREDRVLKGHSAAVRSAAFSSDGRRIVTASDDRTARVWDVQTGGQIAVLREQTAPVRSAVFSPDGLRVVSTQMAQRSGDAASDNNIVTSNDRMALLWDALSGQVIRRFEGHIAQVYDAAFSPDGKHIVTASADNTARVWDAATGMTATVLKGHLDSVLSAAFSFDGGRIVTASADRTARVWDAESGKTIAVLEGHLGPISSASFSPDGEQVVTAADDHTARIWRIFGTVQALVDRSKTLVPRCLTLEQRQNAFLEAQSSAWCFQLKKWPYQTVD
jgi:WD40 repeat protein